MDRKWLTRQKSKRGRQKRESLIPYPPLTLSISPRLKLSSSSAVALKSYLAMASMLGLPHQAVRAVGRKHSPQPPFLPRRLPAQPSHGPAPLEAPAPSLTYRGGQGTIRPRWERGGGRAAPLGEVARIDGRGRAQSRSLHPARRGSRFLPPVLAQARLPRVTRPAANGAPQPAAGGGTKRSRRPEVRGAPGRAGSNRWGQRAPIPEWKTRARDAAYTVLPLRFLPFTQFTPI